MRLAFSFESVWEKGGCAVLAVVLSGGYGAAESGKLRAMNEVRRAMCLDLVERLTAVEGVRAVLVSDQPELLGAAEKLGARGRLSQRPFFWLEEVQAAVRAELCDRQEAVLVMGGGAAPLLQEADVRRLRELAETSASTSASAESGGAWPEPGVVWQNNRLSPDLVLVPRGEHVFRVSACANDNEFGHALETQAGLEMRLLPQEVAFGFDVDTPFDALLAAESVRAGRRLREAAGRIEHRVPLRQVVELLRGGGYPDVAMIGRVHPVLAERFSQAVGMRLRVYSEERGMKALGRIARGEARSLIGAYGEAVGWQAFFRELSETAQAAFVDTRVLFAHRQGRVLRESGGTAAGAAGEEFGLSEQDRFFADLGLYEEVADPWLREFAEAAAEAPIPVLMGGQSLVAGGLRLLQEMILPGEGHLPKHLRIP